MMNLLLGICLLTFGWTQSSMASVPAYARKTIQQLNDYFETSRDIRFGNPLFLGKLDGFEKAEQKLMMTIILDAYNRILTQMEQEQKNENVQRDLKKVIDYLNKLKVHYFSEKHKDLKEFINEVMALKEKDPEVQRKALFELMTVYSEAAKLIHPSVQNHRSRRQVKGSKKQRTKS